MFVSDTWATQYCVRGRVCTRDFELLTVSFRPFYLPREFGQITDILVYVPGPDFENGGRENNREFQRGGFEVGRPACFYFG